MEIGVGAAPWEMIDRYGFPLVRVATRLRGRLVPSVRHLPAQIATGLRDIPSTPERYDGACAALSALEFQEHDWGVHVVAMIEILKLREIVEEALKAEPCLADLLPLLEPPPAPRWDSWEEDEPREIFLDPWLEL